LGIQIQLEKLRSLPPLISQKRIFWVAICKLMWNLKFTQKILLSDYVFTIKFILSKKRWDIMPNRDITNIRWNYKITFIYVEILFKKFLMLYITFLLKFLMLYITFLLKFLMLYITFLLKNFLMLYITFLLKIFYNVTKKSILSKKKWNKWQIEK